MKILLMILQLVFVSCLTSVHADSYSVDLSAIEKGWAIAHYETGKKQKKAVYETLLKEADRFIQSYPKRQEPRVWKAIILSTQAGVVGAFSALRKVKSAQQLLLQVEKIEPTLLKGSIYTSLGSLYYKVPGWPISFGDKKKAEIALKKALKINPEGIEPNFFYAEYLYERDQYQQAEKYCQQASKAPPLKSRPIADKWRRKEVMALMKKIQSKLK